MSCHVDHHETASLPNHLLACTHRACTRQGKNGYPAGGEYIKLSALYIVYMCIVFYVSARESTY